ncbi:MAG TPA: hypothetical protein VEK84_08795 [Terriglobales bacterium]|nr:hypothetical protein [Terriglobales bacterium]
MIRALLFALMLTSASLNGFGQAATSAKYPRVVTELSVTRQSETIPITPFFTPKTDGIYQVSAYMVVTVPGTQGCSDFWVLIVSWIDESGVNTETNVPPVRCIGGSSPSTIVARGVAGKPLKYQVLNSDLPSGEEYDLFLVVEQLINK